MTFQYDPRLAYSCFPPGKYPATLIGAVEGISRKGLPLLTLTFEVKSGERSRRIRGWVANPTSLFMLKELAYALGRGSDFDAGVFDAEKCVGTALVVELRVTTTDGWGEQNAIDHYHRADETNSCDSSRQVGVPAKAQPYQNAAIDDDDIPF